MEMTKRKLLSKFIGYFSTILSMLFMDLVTKENNHEPMWR